MGGTQTVGGQVERVMMGGSAGTLAKSCVAPADRVRILLQVRAVACLATQQQTSPVDTHQLPWVRPCMSVPPWPRPASERRGPRPWHADVGTRTGCWSSCTGQSACDAAASAADGRGARTVARQRCELRARLSCQGVPGFRPPCTGPLATSGLCAARCLPHSDVSCGGVTPRARPS